MPSSSLSFTDKIYRSHKEDDVKNNFCVVFEQVHKSSDKNHRAEEKCCAHERGFWVFFYTTNATHDDCYYSANSERQDCCILKVHVITSTLAFYPLPCS